MPGIGDAPATRRLFFALWPDTALRATAADRVAVLVPPGGGRPQRPEQLHLTLVFLGQVAEPRLASVHGVASEVTGAPVIVALDRVEHWRKPQVLCLTTSEVPAGLSSLVDQLRAALAVAGLPTETRPYRPHLTLARKVTRFHGQREVEPLLWRADAITLVESRSDRQGAHYLPIAHWPLLTAAE
jgi:2'-5' RNA ligase